jgi:hypothetical protein
MNLHNICSKIFNDKYTITPDGENKIVVNCLIPWSLLQKLRPNNDDLEQNVNLVCGIKLCNIPGTVVVIYVNGDPTAQTPEENRTYRYFIVNITTLFDQKVKKLWKKLYIVWGQHYRVNIEFNLEHLIRQQREAENVNEAQNANANGAENAN